MSSIVEQGLGVGDVISLLWFKRSLPRYCTRFIEVKLGVIALLMFLAKTMKFAYIGLHVLPLAVLFLNIRLLVVGSTWQICTLLCADHGPCVSGAHNSIVTARAGKDLVSCLVSGMLYFNFKVVVDLSFNQNRNNVVR